MSYKLVFGVLLLMLGQTHADDLKHSPQNPTYNNECGSCHVPYPAPLLGRSEWKQILGTLDNHFGVDASLDKLSQQQIASYLQQYGATKARVAMTQTATLPRISQSAWFKREHDEISAQVWQRPSIKSAANCIACHSRADKGYYNERQIRIPKS